MNTETHVTGRHESDDPPIAQRTCTGCGETPDWCRCV
jgi:hypothetical protein